MRKDEPEGMLQMKLDSISLASGNNDLLPLKFDVSARRADDIVGGLELIWMGFGISDAAERKKRHHGFFQ